MIPELRQLSPKRQICVDEKSLSTHPVKIFERNPRIKLRARCLDGKNNVRSFKKLTINNKLPSKACEQALVSTAR